MVARQRVDDTQACPGYPHAPDLLTFLRQADGRQACEERVEDDPQRGKSRMTLLWVLYPTRRVVDTRRSPRKHAGPPAGLGWEGPDDRGDPHTTCL